MSERRISGSMWVLIITAIPIVYVLSVGPAAKLNKMGILPDGIAPVYWPLQKAIDNVPAAERVVQWYIRLWV